VRSCWRPMMKSRSQKDYPYYARRANSGFTSLDQIGGQVCYSPGLVGGEPVANGETKVHNALAGWSHMDVGRDEADLFRVCRDC
jgi:hypothetical protein